MHLVRRGLTTCSGLLIVLLGGGLNAFAQTFEIVAPQLGTPPDTGRYPSAGLILASDGNFYGTTYEGGANGVGTVFRMTPAGEVTIIHSFDDTNGSHPYAELTEWTIADGGDGNLYGTTNDQATSSSGVGTVFSISKQGTGFTVVHSLAPYDATLGCFPEGAGILAPLVKGDPVTGTGNLYGVIAAGGCMNPNAAFFRIAPSGANRFSIIGHVPDTGTTSGLTRGSDGFFYGTTDGSSGLGFGVIYRISGLGGDGQVLHKLTRADGYAHTGEMIQSNSNSKFYGTARAGGEYGATFEGGTVFEFVPGADEASSTYTRLYSFAENDAAGSEPYTGLIEGRGDNLLYGTTIRTGANRTFVGADQGGLFRVNPNTLSVEALYTFEANPNSPLYAGSPRGALLEHSRAGQFLGTTYHGGFSGFGTIFRFTLLNSTTTTLAATPLSSVFGQPISLTATVTASGNPSGDVKFLDGTASIGTASVSGSIATLSTSGLSIGTHTMSADYLGDATFLPSTSQAVSVTVSRAATTTTLATSPNPSARKQLVALTATVAAVAPGAGTATGTVQFLEGKKKVGTATLVNGVAALQISLNSMGSHDFTATYAGDANFAASTAPVYTHTVNK